MSVSAASLAKADARFADTNLIRLSDDMMPHVLEAMVLKARTAKVAINKLSEKQITDAIFETKAALEAADEIDPCLTPAGFAPDGLGAPQGDPVDDPEVIAQLEADEAEAAAQAPVKAMRIKKAKAPREVKQIHTSHEGCSHASTKVARATCRRERARAAKA